MTRSWTMWGRLLGSNRILFMVGSCLLIRRFTWNGPGNISLIKLPDNCLIDVSSGDNLGHVAEQPEGEGGPLHKGPLELRPLVMIMMGVITWCSSGQPSMPCPGCSCDVSLCPSRWWPPRWPGGRSRGPPGSMTAVEPPISWLDLAPACFQHFHHCENLQVLLVNDQLGEDHMATWFQDIIELPANSLAWN